MLFRSYSCESVCSQGGALSIDERVEANQRARGRRGRPEREEGLCVDNPYRYGNEVSRREDREGMETFALCSGGGRKMTSGDTHIQLFRRCGCCLGNRVEEVWGWPG